MCVRCNSPFCVCRIPKLNATSVFILLVLEERTIGKHARTLLCLKRAKKRVRLELGVRRWLPCSALGLLPQPKHTKNSGYSPQQREGRHPAIAEMSRWGFFIACFKEDASLWTCATKKALCPKLVSEHTGKLCRLIRCWTYTGFHSSVFRKFQTELVFQIEAGVKQKAVQCIHADKQHAAYK